MPLSETAATAVTERFQARLADIANRASTVSLRAWEQLGAWDRVDIDRFAAATAQAGAVGTGIATGVASFAGSMVPGLGWLSGGFASAQMAQANAQMEQTNKDQAAMMSNMNDVMPQIMRGQRLNDLGTAKKCAFLNQPAPVKS